MSQPTTRATSLRPGSGVLWGLVLVAIMACHSPAGQRATPMNAGTRSEGSSSREAARALVVDSNMMKMKHFEELLIGRFPGVHVRRTPSGGFAVRIRGASTFMTDQEPLFIVDGMPVQPTPGRGLDWLPPFDVARIEVLKDAVDTSMYGSRGANGVILITTRRRQGGQ